MLNCIVFAVIWFIALILLQFIVKSYKNKDRSRLLRINSFSKWTFWMIQLYLFNFVMMRISFFISAFIGKNAESLPLTTIWKQENLVVDLIKIDTIKFTIFRMIGNITGGLNIHILHAGLGMYFLMLICLLQHKKISDRNPIEDLFTRLPLMKSDKTTSSESIFFISRARQMLDPTIRHLTQKFMSRMEMSYLIIYILYLSILFISFLGWTSSQILDYLTLSSEEINYEKLYICWDINHWLIYFILNLHFLLLVFELAAWIVLNCLLLWNLK
jgi:hypothetical protein